MSNPSSGSSKTFDVAGTLASSATGVPSASGSSAHRWEKRLAGLVSITLVALMLLPLLQNFASRPHDCFPFSYYPMFSKRRSEQVTMRFMVASNEHGKQKFVPYKWIGRGGMNQVRKQIRNSVKQGHAQRLCETVARNIGRKRSRRFAFATRVSVVTARYQLSDYVRGEKTPTSWDVEAECRLPRRPAPRRAE